MALYKSTTKDLSVDIATQAANVAVAVVNGGVSPSGLVKLVVDVGSLCWKAHAYVQHKSTVQEKLAVCLEEYRETGYLEVISTTDEAQPTTWRTTPKFREANIIHQVYPDIERYLSHGDFTDQELESLGFNSSVTIYSDKSVCNRLGNLMDRLSASCTRYGVRDYTKTDAHKRTAIVSSMQMAAIALENAFLAEAERRKRGETPSVVPVLGRILGIAALCGITEIGLPDIPILFGKMPIFETVVRARIAKLRNAHASEVFNTLLFNGNTESVARRFGELATKFSGELLIVGRVKAEKKSEFLPEYASFNCELSGPRDRKHAIGTPIYMTAGWANLIQRREHFGKKYGASAQMMQTHVPAELQDIHGNTYNINQWLSEIVFKVKELPNGTLMAKPRYFGLFDYMSDANHKGGFSSGEEKMFGGVVGRPVCSCNGVPNIRKGELTKEWKLGPYINISRTEYVSNSIIHTQGHSTRQVAILWQPGDWMMGAFMMQILPQSSYLQGKAECLHCAVENAALYGCAEVIVCGGGTVSAEALKAEALKVEALKAETPRPQQGCVSNVQDRG